MDVIDIANQYGITVTVIGIISCIICGLLKVPIAKRIRNHCETKGLDAKIASDRIRNVCNGIVVVLSIILICSWHIACNGIKVMLSTKVYTDILTTFTVAKLIYMLYEGAGNVSIKKLIKRVFDVLTTKIASQKIETNMQQSKSADYLISCLKDKLLLPLTVAQTQELKELLTIQNIKGEK